MSTANTMHKFGTISQDKDGSMVFDGFDFEPADGEDSLVAFLEHLGAQFRQLAWERREAIAKGHGVQTFGKTPEPAVSYQQDGPTGKPVASKGFLFDAANSVITPLRHGNEHTEYVRKDGVTTVWKPTDFSAGDRPDYVACIETEVAGPKTSWCGRRLSIEWAFAGANHAALAVQQGSRMVPCEQCADAVVKALKGMK